MSITKDTLFNDLPQHVKQKIINIRTLGSLNRSESLPTPIKEYSHTSIPSVKNINDVFVDLCKCAQNLKNFNCTQSLKDELNKFCLFSDLYRANLEEKDFVAEFEKTISMLESRFDALKNSTKIN